MIDNPVISFTLSSSNINFQVKFFGHYFNTICNAFCLYKQTQMIELCRTEGQKLLFEGKYDRVVPAALESLKFSIEVYGLSSIELVPSYLILGEASIGKYKHIWPSSLVKPSNHVCDTK